MGSSLSRLKLRKGYTPDGAILTSNDTMSCFPPRFDDIYMDMNGTGMGLRFDTKTTEFPESPSDCTTLSTLSSAAPLDAKHKYHLFFAYDPHDKAWVDSVVRRLEDEPYNFRCCSSDRDFSQHMSHVQNIMCSVMLSQRVIVVLTRQFIRESWADYENSIIHVTSLSQRRQRVMPILLEDCEGMVPDSLRLAQPIAVNQDSLWDGLLLQLQADGIPLSDSLQTIRSLSSQMDGYTNGQRLVTNSATVKGYFKPQLLFNYCIMPPSLLAPSVSMDAQEYRDIVRTVGCEDIGQRLSWLYSAVPLIIIMLIFTLWCIALILIIFLYPENTPSTLPVRLCVFTLPAALIVSGCILRWRYIKQHQEELAMTMFSRSIYANKILYESHKPLLISTARTNSNQFNICFTYYNRSDCMENIKLLLTHCTDTEVAQLSKLVDVYTTSSTYLHERPLAIRLMVMMSSAYILNFSFRTMSHCLEQRHTKKRQCLCQYIEEFLALYLHCERNEAKDDNIKHIFLKYLNCHLDMPDTMPTQFGMSHGIVCYTNAS